MPVELPGFYFDGNRNRYFPKSSQENSSKPPNPPTGIIASNAEPPLGSGDVQEVKQQHTPWRFQQTRLMSLSYTEIMREFQYVGEQLS